MKKILLVAFSLTLMQISKGQNCGAGTSGFTPINDLGAGTFNSWTGGLYPNGSNYLPSGHKAAGLNMAGQIQCLEANGVPDAVNGKIVWLSIGMSNTTMETQQFIPLANAYVGKNPKLTLVDGALGGMQADFISDPNNSNYPTYWNTVNTRLANAGVTAQQVQVIWFKEADAGGSTPAMTYHDSLVDEFIRIMHDIKIRFPNAKLCYLASRISARYANTTLNPEPYAYYQGWAVKHVIEQQINNSAQLQYSGSNPNSPWLCWGRYLWSDGSTPQVSNPNIFWSCPADFQSDGTHPSIPVGALKVANLLLNFFVNDSTTTPWFLGTGCPTPNYVNESYSSGSGLNIFPDPSEGHTSFEFTSEYTQVGYWEVLDVLGQRVANGTINVNEGKNKLDLNLSELSTGLYTMRITAENFSVSKKFILAK